MSRIGKKPIAIPQGVKASVEKGKIKIVGPKGELELNIPKNVEIEIGEKEITVSVAHPEEKSEKALWGTVAKLIANMIKGVCEGYEKSLELVGIGFKVAVAKDEVVLEIGYSHPLKFKLPKGITASADKNTLTIKGIDKALVGNVAAAIRALRKPEPYKGKGIKYAGEIIRRKVGKAAKTTAA